MFEKLSAQFETKESIIQNIRTDLLGLDGEISGAPNTKKCVDRLLTKPKVNQSFTSVERKFIDSIKSKYDGPALYKGWERIKPHLSQIYKDCAKENIPFEFAMIPMIESYFKSNAGRPGAAYGPWQFLKGTANEYGLKDRTSYSESSKAGVKYCADLYNKLKKKYDLDQENAFNFACLAYNTGLSKAQVFCKYFDGDFSKVLPYLQGSDHSGLKKAFADNNAAIRRAGGTAFQSFPSAAKIKEIREYAYKIPCFLELISKNEGNELRTMTESSVQKNPEKSTVESSETFQEGNISLDTLDSTTATLSSGNKAVTIYISKNNKLKYQENGNPIAIEFFNSEDDFHTKAMKNILDKAFGEDRTSAPKISRTILARFYPDGITPVERGEEKNLEKLENQESENIIEDSLEKEVVVPKKKSLEVLYLDKEGAQISSSANEDIMIFPVGDDSIEYFIDGRQDEGMKVLSFKSKEDFIQNVMKEILDDSFGTERKSIPEEAEEIYKTFYQ